MYQITFSKQSMEELNRLKIPDQMQLVKSISNLSQQQLAHPREPLGKFHREGKTFYRLRAGEFRLYFEVEGDLINNRYILHKNTLTDFIVRTKLPLSQEQLAEQHHSFWKYLQTLTKKLPDEPASKNQ